MRAKPEQVQQQATTLLVWELPRSEEHLLASTQLASTQLVIALLVIVQLAAAQRATARLATSQLATVQQIALKQVTPELFILKLATPIFVAPTFIESRHSWQWHRREWLFCSTCVFFCEVSIQLQSFRTWI